MQRGERFCKMVLKVYFWWHICQEFSFSCGEKKTPPRDLLLGYPALLLDPRGLFAPWGLQICLLTVLNTQHGCAGLIGSVKWHALTYTHRRGSEWRLGKPLLNICSSFSKFGLPKWWWQSLWSLELQKHYFQTLVAEAKPLIGLISNANTGSIFLVSKLKGISRTRFVLISFSYRQILTELCKAVHAETMTLVIVLPSELLGQQRLRNLAHKTILLCHRWLDYNIWGLLQELTVLLDLIMVPFF